MSNFNLTETMKIVDAIEPQIGAAITGVYVSLRNINMVWVVVHIAQGNVATVAITLEKATHVAATGTTAIVQTVPIWVNADCAASDTLVREGTDAVSYTTAGTVSHKMIVFKVDPAAFGIRAATGLAFDCLTVITGASDAANLTSAIYYLDARYGADQPPAAITD